MILLTGNRGLVGCEVARQLDLLHIPYFGINTDNCDITNSNAVQDLFMKKTIDAVIHTAAYTAVDQAEIERERAYVINVDGTRNLVEACNTANAKLAYISTDYIFSGQGKKPHEIRSVCAPVNWYGQTKLMGEEYVRQMKNGYVVRTSWVYGQYGHNFVQTMIQKAQTGKPIRVVEDQIGSPTYAEDLVDFLVKLIQTDKYGIYHATNEGFCSWFDFAQAIFQYIGLDVICQPIKSDEYPIQAKRPLNSRLSKKSLSNNGFARLPSWSDALYRYINKITKIKGSENHESG